MKIISIVSVVLLLGHLSYKYKQDFYETISFKDFFNKDNNSIEEQSWLEKFKSSLNSPLEGSDSEEGLDDSNDDVDGL